MEWVEVRGRTVEVAVEAALAELGLESAEAAEVEVIQQAEKGFLGIGRSDAIVRVKAKPKKRKRRRKTKKSGEASRDSGRGGRSGSRNGGQGNRRPRQGGDSKPEPSGKGRTTEHTKPRRPRRQEETMDRRSNEPSGDDAPEATLEERREVVHSFLAGLLDAFGLEGEVTTKGEDGIVYASIDGAQTEALIGTRGTIMQSLHEITRTVAQRKIREGTRLRLDVAGYAERRREALQIYARRLAEQVLEEGGEVMLEAMNPADRKVIHDAIADIDGVRSYSEGEEPHRSVVIAAE